MSDQSQLGKDPMNADVLTTIVADGVAIITLGSARRIYVDEGVWKNGLARGHASRESYTTLSCRPFKAASW